MAGDEGPPPQGWRPKRTGIRCTRDKGTSRPARALLQGVVAPLGLSMLAGSCVLIAVVAYSTHGWLWSVYVPIYGHLLHSIPLPPGVVEGTQRIALDPEWPWADMQYEVSQPHDETVAFFEARLPGVGWTLLEHKAWAAGPGGDLQLDRMLLSRHERYWLIVNIATSILPDGTADGPSHVILEVYRSEQEATSRY